MKNSGFLHDVLPRYLHPSVIDTLIDTEENYFLYAQEQEEIYEIIFNETDEDDNKKENYERLLFYRRSFLYEHFEYTQPYEISNTVAYELAVRTPKVIAALKNVDLKANELRKEYWLSREECMDFEKGLYRVLKKGSFASRDPFIFMMDMRRGPTMELPYSRPKIIIPNIFQDQKIYIKIDLALPEDEVNAMMDAFKLSLLKYKGIMDKTVSGSLEKDFLSSKETYFKGAKSDDNALRKILRGVKYPNIKNNNIAERFFAYDMTKSGFHKNSIIRAIMMYRYFTALQHTKIKMEITKENIDHMKSVMTTLTRATLNVWINTIQDAIDKKLYKQYVCPKEHKVNRGL